MGSATHGYLLGWWMARNGRDVSDPERYMCFASDSVGGDDMMDDYSRIVALESELSDLRSGMATAYMVGYRDGSALHHYIPAEVTQELLRVLDHGEVKHPGEEWKRALPHVHMFAATAHIKNLMAGGREREAESGCYHLAHAIVRYMFALAQFMGAVPMVHKEEV